MKEKFKDNNYFYWGLTLFLAIAASIVLYFLCMRLDSFFLFIGKIMSILSPIFLGILFAYILNPFEKNIEKFISKKVTPTIFKDDKKHNKFNRVTGITVTFLVVGLLIFLFLKFVVPNLLESMQMMITNIPVYIENIYEYLKTILKSNSSLYSVIDSLNANVTEYVKNIVVPSMDTIMAGVASGITGFIKGVMNVAIGLIVSIYILYDKEMFIRGSVKVLKAVFSPKVYDVIMEALNYTNKVFGGFLSAKIIDSLIIGVLTFIVISIFRVPYALLIAVIVGVTNVIPYFGPFIGAIPCAALLLMIDPSKCLTFIVLIFLIQQFDGNVLGPKLIGNKTGIKSFWVLFSILLFGGLFGIVGMIFGVPVFAVIYSIIVSSIDKKLDKKQAQ